MFDRFRRLGFQLTTGICALFVRNITEERCSHPLPSPILPSFLLQGSCTPLMVATLHPPSAGIAPQYSLPLGLGTGVGQPTFLEHTATVLVKQRQHLGEKAGTRATSTNHISFPYSATPIIYWQTPFPLSPTSYTGLVFMSCIKCLSRLSVVIPTIAHFCQEFSGRYPSQCTFGKLLHCCTNVELTNIPSLSTLKDPTAHTIFHPPLSFSLGILKAWSACVAAMACAFACGFS